MRFIETGLEDALVIELERIEDERGFFARAWDAKTFADNGLNPRIVQCNISFNRVRGTLRGMHYQAPPFAEAKLVRCTSGEMYDVIVDLREESPSYKHHFGAILSADNRRLLYVPEGFAHGFVTMEDNTEVFYQMSEFYAPEYARGVRWNDPQFAIKWPIAPTVISRTDANYPDFEG